MFIAFTVPVPAVQLFKILPVTFLVGAVPPSVKFNPVIVVEPEIVIFEKLLFWQFEIQPVTEEPLSVIKITPPEAPPLTNAITIELLFVFLTDVAVPEYDCEINVTVPVVFTFRLLNVLFAIVAILPAAVAPVNVI